jgi:hypothetical protein
MPRMRSALGFRRAAVVSAPALSALLIVAGFFGFMLALPVALFAAWRAGLLDWWPPVLLLAGAICAQATPDGFGLLVWAATLAVLSYVLWRSGSEPAATP